MFNVVLRTSEYVVEQSGGREMMNRSVFRGKRSWPVYVSDPAILIEIMKETSKGLSQDICLLLRLIDPPSE